MPIPSFLIGESLCGRSLYNLDMRANFSNFGKLYRYFCAWYECFISVDWVYKQLCIWGRNFYGHSSCCRPCRVPLSLHPTSDSLITPRQMKKLIVSIASKNKLSGIPDDTENVSSPLIFQIMTGIQMNHGSYSHGTVLVCPILSKIEPVLF